MNDNFRGFGTEPCTLLVGPNEEKLYVPRGLLNQIPYFDQAFIADGKVDSEKTQLRMPDFDPKALADVVYFFWTKTVPELDGNTKAGGKTDSRDAVNMRVRAYIAAQKLALGWMQRGIERQLVLYHQNHDIDPRNLILLHQAGLRGSILYKFTMAELGYLFSKKSLEMLENMVPGFTAVCETMPQEVLWDFLKATDSGYDFGTEDRPSKQASWLNDSVIELADTEDKS